MTFKNSIFCVIFTSVESEVYLSNKVNLVQTAMDAFGTTGRIFPYKYEFTETPDRDYTTSPSGFSPVLLSETSYKNIYLPEHRELMRKQISSGKVEMFFIVKYETLKWYLSKGSMYGDELRGVCVNIPDYLVKSKYSPQNMIHFTNVFEDKFKKLTYETGEDITTFYEAVKDVLKAWRIEN